MADCLELLKEWEQAAEEYMALDLANDELTLYKAWGCWQKVPDPLKCAPFVRQYHARLQWEELAPCLTEMRRRGDAGLRKEIPEWLANLSRWELAGDMYMEDGRCAHSGRQALSRPPLQGPARHRPGLCLKGRGAIGEIPELSHSGHRGRKAVGGRLLAVGNAVGAGVGVWECL